MSGLCSPTPGLIASSFHADLTILVRLCALIRARSVSLVTRFSIHGPPANLNELPWKQGSRQFIGVRPDVPHLLLLTITEAYSVVDALWSVNADPRIGRRLRNLHDVSIAYAPHHFPLGGAYRPVVGVETQFIQAPVNRKWFIRVDLHLAIGLPI
jgi:hypothetical protein